MKVIITGMHRSGTSMIAGLLQICGLYLGDNLLGRAKSNAKGHFEDRGFLQFNEDLLKASGGSWSHPPKAVMEPGPLVFDKMKAFVAGWPRNRIVGWKDPRACLTIHLWQRAIEPEELRVILVTRPADEIAASLKRRNNLGLHQGENLAFFYQRQALLNFERRKTKWTTTHYPLYFGHLTKELKKILKFLDLKMPEDAYEVAKFVDPDMRHHWKEGTND